MHIPDGFIDGKTAATAAVLAGAGVSLALRQAKRELPPRKVPLLGLAAAFLFVAQMINFPVVAGTSGHLMGGVLIAALLGPSAAVIVVTAVLIVQCFLFADGGVLALGANIFNMALAGTVGGHFIYTLVKRFVPGLRGQVTAVAFAGWCSTVLASIGCAGQLAWSGTIEWTAAFTAMTGVHMLIGIGEGLIGALVFLGVQQMRPELLAQPEAPQPRRPAHFAAFALLLTIGFAVFVAPWACPWPDGLESVAEKLGFGHRTAGPLFAAPASDYQAPWLQSTAAATAAAGLAGTLIIFGLTLLLGRILVRRRTESTGAGQELCD